MDLLLLGFTLIFSLTVHEYSHACAALVLGDTTAKDQGRLTLNPLKHLDLVSNFVVLSFNNEKIFYKVIYNGTPDKLFDEIKETGLNLKKNNQTWEVQ